MRIKWEVILSELRDPFYLSRDDGSGRGPCADPEQRPCGATSTCTVYEGEQLVEAHFVGEKNIEVCCDAHTGVPATLVRFYQFPSGVLECRCGRAFKLRSKANEIKRNKLLESNLSILFASMTETTEPFRFELDQRPEPLFWENKMANKTELSTATMRKRNSAPPELHGQMGRTAQCRVSAERSACLMADPPY